MNICVNCANLHVGGGVQVAVSFLYEFLKNKLYIKSGNSYSLVVSQKVNLELCKILDMSEVNINYYVHDTYGLSAISFSNLKLYSKFDLIFTVFGPSYFWIPGVRQVVGFAQPWIIYPKNEVQARFSVINKLKTYLIYKIKYIFFNMADSMIVELNHVEQKLRDIGYKKNIYVINNCVSSVFFDSSLWGSVDVAKYDDVFSIGYVTRNYPHKNVEILKDVKKIIRDKYKCNVNFYVTLNDDEMNSLGSDFSSEIYTVGPIDINQCPDFYKKMDAIIFPSFLECFSAAPIEALISRRPLFAADRNFVRDVCGEYAIYFNPSDAGDIARAIFEYISNGFSTSYSLDDAYDHIKNFSNPIGRAKEYFSVIDEFS